ncbi:MAG TPA: hypothetical protein DCZ97_11430 [Syntrophus sp. (in: bacteria)]|nr:hypothetical protein [Syntrophus sp. (in: bacteria)]
MKRNTAYEHFTASSSFGAAAVYKIPGACDIRARRVPGKDRFGSREEARPAFACRALGVTSAKRTSLVPDVPAISESVPGYEYKCVIAGDSAIRASRAPSSWRRRPSHPMAPCSATPRRAPSKRIKIRLSLVFPCRG